MQKNKETIKGYSLFKTEEEKKYVKHILEHVEELVPEENFKWLVPNMIIDSHGKAIITGFYRIARNFAVFVRVK